MKTSRGTPLDTRERLLNVGGEVFSRRGFNATTVREISRRAKVNLAAINYHFGNKRGLYLAVLKNTFNSAIQKYPLDPDLGDNSTAEDRLHDFIRSLLCRILDDGRPAWHGKLMARELIEPTVAFDQLVEEAVRPLHEILFEIVRGLMGNDVSAELIRLCALSIIGQCLFYYHGRLAILKLYSQRLDAREIDRLTDHITRFSIAAIRGFTNGGPA